MGRGGADSRLPPGAARSPASISLPGPESRVKCRLVNLEPEVLVWPWEGWFNQSSLILLSNKMGVNSISEWQSNLVAEKSFCSNYLSAYSVLGPLYVFP